MLEKENKSAISRPLTVLVLVCPLSANKDTTLNDLYKQPVYCFVVQYVQWGCTLLDAGG